MKPKGSDHTGVMYVGGIDRGTVSIWLAICDGRSDGLVLSKRSLEVIGDGVSSTNAARSIYRRNQLHAIPSKQSRLTTLVLW
mmetsp:Transcript_36923/g.67744  ORF Transcript_36923/g.67744 Transcript_36923/m.67744 type:complete len:82 (-) Transcript_36923:225-470(-)